MMTYEPDPDVVRWGLNSLVDVFALSHSGSYNSVTQYRLDAAEVGHVEEYYAGIDSNNVENDAVIARALQDELSRLAAAEASGINNNLEEELVISQSWSSSPHPSENENRWIVENDWRKNESSADASRKNEEADSSKMRNGDTDEISASTSLSGARDKSLDTEELTISLDLSDDEALDGEVGKKFDQMVAVPHLPKVNGEMPSADEEISDHQRLLDRLKVYDLVENKVQGDGNCQFRSLSDQLYHSPDHHKLVRERVIDQLKSQPHLYEGYVPMAYGDYLNKMCKSGEWGDHVTLQAAADSYGLRIFVMTSFKDTCYIEILPLVQKSERVIYLSFWAEVHYNSIYPEGELALYETKKKKKWWEL